MAPKTIKCYLAAIRHLQISLQTQDPKISMMPRLEQVIKGAKRNYMYASRTQDRRICLPITPDILTKMKAVWERSATDFDTVMM